MSIDPGPVPECCSCEEALWLRRMIFNARCALAAGERDKCDDLMLLALASGDGGDE